MNTRMIEVNVGFVIATLENRYEEVNVLLGNDASESLWEQVLSLVEECGLGTCSSPPAYVDNYLINGEFVSKYDACQNGYISKDKCEYDEDEEQWIVTDKDWNEYCQDNALIYNDEYACLQF